METASVLSNRTGEDNNCSYCGTVLWMFVNVFIAFAAVLGNTLTISAILLSKKLSSMISNHFVFSLAVSDALVGFSVPYHMCFYVYEDFGKKETNCLLRFVLTSFACASSICNLLFIATDRYIAIVYPLHYSRYMLRRTAACLIAIGWMASFAMATVPIVWNDWHEGVACEVINVLPNNYLKFIVCPMFVLIWLMMLMLYTRICREASGHAKRIRSTASVPSALTIRDSKSFQVNSYDPTYDISSLPSS
ncbi:hypothetical protein NQ318_017343 [Aromia moschata]|uniref:G-protein coupled receptors family 1 profile domain-containing protein n=1 Tax=Aromia moschata TaxID=1265417 RepID=A0AAV8XAT9_9CUCU|nr:hypothetical protein NQ318_017343 [Aromia moschata]